MLTEPTKLLRGFFQSNAIGKISTITWAVVANCFYFAYAVLFDVTFRVKWDHIGDRGFEPPASASQTQRSDQAELLSVIVYTF